MTRDSVTSRHQYIVLAFDSYLTLLLASVLLQKSNLQSAWFNTFFGASSLSVEDPLQADPWVDSDWFTLSGTPSDLFTWLDFRNSERLCSQQSLEVPPFTFLAQGISVDGYLTLPPKGLQYYLQQLCRNSVSQFWVPIHSSGNLRVWNSLALTVILPYLKALVTFMVGRLFTSHHTSYLEGSPLNCSKVNSNLLFMGSVLVITLFATLNELANSAVTLVHSELGCLMMHLFHLGFQLYIYGMVLHRALSAVTFMTDTAFQNTYSTASIRVSYLI